MTPAALLRPGPRVPRRGLLLAALAAVVLAALSPLAPLARAGEGRAADAPTAAAGAWDDATVDVARRLPVQDLGRVKPLDTFATYTLLGVAHKRSVKAADGTSLDPTRWLLDVMFRPSVARKCKCFLVENDEVLDAVDVNHEGRKKRDVYAFDELEAAMPRLRELALVHMKKESKDRTAVENGLVDLFHATTSFQRLLTAFDWTRAEVEVKGSDLERALGGRTRVRVTDLLAQPDALVAALQAAPHGRPDPATPVGKLLAALDGVLEGSMALRIVPPVDGVGDAPEWYAPGDLVFAALRGTPLPPDYAGLVRALAALGASADDPRAFHGALAEVGATTQRLATARGEYGKVALELTLNRLDPFHRAAHLYLLAFVVVAVTWVVRARWLRTVSWVLVGGTLAYHVLGVVLRCVLRERPPITTLYETVLFISGAGVAALLVAEAFDRRRIAFAVAPVIGWLGLSVANSYEALKGEDTMPQLVAVLDTNFWLSIHVTCIAIGYLGGLLAAALAHVTVLGQAFGLRRGDADFHRGVQRLTYGMLAFGLLFSVVGTILGGIWANESWGRFWGWDPKENGALMICLAQLAILHGRLGGYLRPYGFAVATVAHSTVIAFSWWHVNLLGIGLHAYGFTQGVLTTLLVFYVFEAVVVGIGMWHALGRRGGASAVAS